MLTGTAWRGISQCAPALERAAKVLLKQRHLLRPDANERRVASPAADRGDDARQSGTDTVDGPHRRRRVAVGAKPCERTVEDAPLNAMHGHRVAEVVEGVQNEPRRIANRH